MNCWGREFCCIDVLILDILVCFFSRGRLLKEYYLNYHGHFKIPVFYCDMTALVLVSGGEMCSRVCSSGDV